MRQPGRRRPLLLALLLSASLHALGILTVPAHQAQSRPSAPAPIEVALLRPEPPTPPEPPRPEVALPRQIVAPPDTVNERPPDRPRFESDRDNVVLRESVRPGVPKPAPPLPPPTSSGTPGTGWRIVPPRRRGPRPGRCR